MASDKTSSGDDDTELEFLGDGKSTKNHAIKGRAVWTRKTEYLLSLIGFTVGLGVVWRFPYLCMRNGGGAFLIPYVFFIMVCGFPLYLLEVAIGQFSGKSCLVIWCICPLMKGIGYCAVLVSFIITWYYGLVIAWILCYLFYSFYPIQPWSTCDNAWNSPNCISSRTRELLHGNNSLQLLNGTGITYNVNNTGLNNSLQLLNGTGVTYNVNNAGLNKTSAYYPTAANEFWRFCILNQSSGLDSWGTVQWHLVLALFISFVTVFLCVIKGVKSVGKVAYVSVVLPYVLLTAIFIKSMTLEGSVNGVLFFLRPDFSKLLHFQVWLEAGVQVFYSLGPAWGGVITMASYNKFHNSCVRDALIVTLTDLFSAMFSGLVVFAILGFLAHEAGMGISEIAEAGPGLVFQAYPEALTRLPLPQLWAVLFFVMLFTVGLDSQFGQLETVISGFVDLFPKVFKKRKTLLLLALFSVYMVTSLIFATQAGVYLFQLIDWYASIIFIFLTSFLECVIIGYIYGAERFSRDLEIMIGKTLHPFFRVSICIVTPAAMLMGLIGTLLNYQHPTYKGYTYPDYITVIGVMISLVSVLPVPILALYQLITSTGTIAQKFKKLTRPSSEWEPHDDVAKMEYKVFNYNDNLLESFRYDLCGTRR